MPACVQAARASGDIVYCARYYAAPGSKATSHFHLYRIDPTGRGRKQLTFGDHDDALLGWSPDGKSILYSSDDLRLSVLNADTGKTRVILTRVNSASLDLWQVFWWPDSKAVIVLTGSENVVGSVISTANGDVLSTMKDVNWLSTSPDGERAYINNGAGGAVASLADDYHVNIIRSLPVQVKAADWVGDQAIVGVAEGEGDAEDDLVGFNENGTKLWVRTVAPHHWSSVDLGTPFRNVTGIPGDRRNVVLGEDISNSTIRPDYNFWRANVDTGNATLWLSEKQFIRFKPPTPSPSLKGRESRPPAVEEGAYLTSPAKALVNYGKPVGGHQRQVYVCGLQVGKDALDAHPKTIVTGMVFVDWADWR